MAHDHMLEIEGVLSDASQVNFKSVNENELKAKGLQNSLEGEIYRSLPLILDQYQEAISTHYPDTFRNVAGYNLTGKYQSRCSPGRFRRNLRDYDLCQA